MPRLLKPFMQGPLREMAKESVPGLNARNGRRPPRRPEPGRRPSAFCRLFHFPRRAPRRACCCVCSSSPGLARYRRALPPVFPQRAAPDLSWTSSNCLFACGPPSIFRERQVHDFQGDCLFNLEQAPRRGSPRPGARPSCAAGRSSRARARSTRNPPAAPLRRHDANAIPATCIRPQRFANGRCSAFLWAPIVGWPSRAPKDSSNEPIFTSHEVVPARCRRDGGAAAGRHWRAHRARRRASAAPRGGIDQQLVEQLRLFEKEIARSQYSEFCATVRMPPAAVIEHLEEESRAGDAQAQVLFMWVFRLIERYKEDGCGDT